jgi:hypothetical protein
MPTTPGVIRLTTGAKLWIGVPPASGIGAPAWAEHTVLVIRAIPPDTTSAEKTLFIAVETLDLAETNLGKQQPA